MSEHSGSYAGRPAAIAGGPTDLAALLRFALEQHQRGRLDAAGGSIAIFWAGTLTPPTRSTSLESF